MAGPVWQTTQNGIKHFNTGHTYRCKSYKAMAMVSGSLQETVYVGCWVEYTHMPKRYSCCILLIVQLEHVMTLDALALA